jgi:hypothetical protein
MNGSLKNTSRTEGAETRLAGGGEDTEEAEEECVKGEVTDGACAYGRIGQLHIWIVTLAPCRPRPSPSPSAAWKLMHSENDRKPDRTDRAISNQIKPELTNLCLAQFFSPNHCAGGFQVV